MRFVRGVADEICIRGGNRRNQVQVQMPALSVQFDVRLCNGHKRKDTDQLCRAAESLPFGSSERLEVQG